MQLFINRESSPKAEPDRAIPAHSSLGSKLKNSDSSGCRGILGLLGGNFGDEDNSSASNENTDLLKVVILLGWQESKENQS